MITLEFPLPGTKAMMKGYLWETPRCGEERRPCVIICPGGGYAFLSPREADPVALSYLARGFQAFVLYYSVLEEIQTGEKPLGLLPLCEISAAVMAVRQHAQEWGVASDKVVVCGFSAGGHLAGSLGVLWDHPRLRAVQDTLGGLNRPDAVLLCYPVVTAGEYAHQGSFDRLTGGDGALEELFSLQKHVGPQTPPVFLWHTVDDDSVPVENSLFLACALRSEKVPMECHFYGRGEHGASMCSRETDSEDPYLAGWFELSLQWLGECLDFPL